MENSNKIYVYVDESGDTILPQDDTMDYYTIIALFVKDTELDNHKNIAKEIVSKHAGSGELKSSSIANNIERRKTILQEISQNNFAFYCLAVDKQRIIKDSGLKYRPSFYKFLHRMFYSRIKKAFNSIEVISDQYGRSEFMSSFIKYMEENENLFDTISFLPSPQEPLLQIADVLAGSIRRVYLRNDPAEILEILKYPSIPIEEWPPNYSFNTDNIEDSYGKSFDLLIQTHSLNSARNFIENNINSADEETIIQIEVLRYLLFRYHEDPTEYVFREEIVDFLISEGIDYNNQSLSIRILAKLRDQDVLLSSTDKGIKIPFNSKDINDWINRINTQVVPYLNRLEKARNSLLIASHSKYDIVNENNFEDLLKYLKK